MTATKKAQIDKVADWIVNDCLDVKSEIVWLLEKLFVERVEFLEDEGYVRTLNEDIAYVYDHVFESVEESEVE